MLHPFFEILNECVVGSASSACGPTGRILFRVQGLEPQACLVILEPNRVHVVAPAESTAEAELTLFCDREQLDAMLTRGVSGRPLRYAGQRELLDALAARLRPAVGWLDLLRAQAKRSEL